jgi:hypothetical protein
VALRADCYPSAPLLVTIEQITPAPPVTPPAG